MMVPFINITSIWSLAHSLEVILFVVGDRDSQVLLEVSTNNDNETWYLEKPFFHENGHRALGQEIQIMVENLHPLSKYTLCPSLIDDFGKVLSEGMCKMASTGAEVDCTEAVIIASVFFGLLLFFFGVGFVGYRLIHKGLRQGFNLPNLSRPKE